MRRRLILLALVWTPFLSIFGFAAPALAEEVGDSAPHLVFHVVAIGLLVSAVVVARGLLRGGAGDSDDGAAPVGRVERGLLRALVGTLALAVAGHLVELAAALERLAADGWVSRRTPEVFEGPGWHASAAGVTIPASMASMLLVLALVVLAARRPGRDRGTGTSAGDLRTPRSRAGSLRDR